ncbi:unnamed protein product, partial [Rotaria magnacalcarata]
MHNSGEHRRFLSLKFILIYFKACRELSSNVNIRNILISLIDRLTAYSTREGTQQNIPENVELFEIFSEQIAEV